jgi:hypothetical protein
MPNKCAPHCSFTLLIIVTNGLASPRSIFQCQPATLSAMHFLTTSSRTRQLICSKTVCQTAFVIHFWTSCTRIFLGSSSALGLDVSGVTTSLMNTFSLPFAIISSWPSFSNANSYVYALGETRLVMRDSFLSFPDNHCSMHANRRSRPFFPGYLPQSYSRLPPHPPYSFHWYN